MSSLAGAHAPMTPIVFIKKWKRASLNERQSAHEHFIDLCGLLEHPTPGDDDPTGERFAFEKGAAKVGGGKGFADVWKRDHFAWEYKRKNGNLDDALHQLIRYAPALESPPLHVVCDIDHIQIHTAWTNTVPAKYELSIDDLADARQRDILRNVFHDPEKLKPSKTRAAVTAEAADKFSTIALRLQGRDTPEAIAHFVNQLVFCFFATSVKLLPDGLFAKLLKRAALKPDKATTYFDKLFGAMETGGEFDLNDIAWFNGGLFDGRRAIRLDDGDIGLLVAAGSLDWSLIDPSIFGTLFERFLDPDKRAQIGAHYTDQDKITRIIEPVILKPLWAEWEVAKAEIERLLSRDQLPPMRAKQKRRMTPIEAAEEVRSRYLERLRTLQILDPACGSGNFLYLALQGVKDIENRANLACELLGLPPRLPIVGPEILRGIEINPLAAELARTTIWIGDIQWRIRNGIHARPIPILRKLDSIECRDALVTRSASGDGLFGRKGEAILEADWPAAEFIVGNPPFLGAKLMNRKIGVETTQAYRTAFTSRLAGFSDLVCYWFEKSRQQVEAGRTKKVGLVATSSIRGGTNRPVLDRITAELTIFHAWSAQPWMIEGARVEVSLICFSARDHAADIHLDGERVSHINPDLTTGVNIASAMPLHENHGVSFLGVQKSGPLDVSGETARLLMMEPLNANGASNASILRPYWNGDDLTGRPRDQWLIDFPLKMTERAAALYEAPFAMLRSARYDPGNPADSRTLVEARAMARDANARERWWEPYWPRPELRDRLAGLPRYIATAETAEHRIFIWLHPPVIPDKNLIIIARSDDTTFGILHSRFHEIWSLRLGTSLEDRPRYTSTTTFETYPFPDHLAPSLPASRHANSPYAAAIAKAAKRLDDLRNAWLNPADLIRVESEVVADFPPRILPKDTRAAAILRERTLTNLYNKRPQWLSDAHRDLDAAVAAAYGWDVDISDQDALARLLELNLSRAAPAQRKVPRSRSPEDLHRSPEFTLAIDGGRAPQKRRPAKKTEETTVSGKMPSRPKKSA